MPPAVHDYFVPIFPPCNKPSGYSSLDNLRCTKWARVKGQTENALLKMPFNGAYMFRDGYIQPLHGIRTKTKWYGAVYAMIGPFYPLWKWLFAKYVTTTEWIGRAMLHVAHRGAAKSVFENQDINAVCEVSG
jgi:hypothetical protein